MKENATLHASAPHPAPQVGADQVVDLTTGGEGVGADRPGILLNAIEEPEFIGKGEVQPVVELSAEKPLVSAEDAPEKKEGAAPVVADGEPSLRTEESFAEVLGLSRQAVAALRKKHLIENVDWKKQGRHVVLAPSGEEKLRKVVEVSAEAVEKKEGAAPVVVPELIVLKVARNPRLLLATDGRRKDLRVRVRNNARFRPGMRLPGCEVVDAAAGYYLFRGRPSIKR